MKCPCRERTRPRARAASTVMLETGEAERMTTSGQKEQGARRRCWLPSHVPIMEAPPDADPVRRDATVSISRPTPHKRSWAFPLFPTTPCDPAFPAHQRSPAPSYPPSLESVQPCRQTALASLLSTERELSRPDTIPIGFIKDPTPAVSAWCSLLGLECLLAPPSSSRRKGYWLRRKAVSPGRVLLISSR